MNDIGLSKTCLVEFKGLSLGSVQSSGLAYRQYHLQVTVDSHSPDVKFNSITPEQTTTFERSSEVTSSSEQTQNATCISQGDLRGSVWWGFRVEDSAEGTVKSAWHGARTCVRACRAAVGKLRCVHNLGKCVQNGDRCVPDRFACVQGACKCVNRVCYDLYVCTYSTFIQANVYSKFFLLCRW